MRLSYSLSKNILETAVGGILNKFGIKSRRLILSFDDIGTEYIAKCEKSGYGKEMEKIGQKWMAVCFKELVPSSLKKLPPTMLLNLIMKKTWIDLGLMDDFHTDKKNTIILIKTKGEKISKVIGKNGLMTGFYEGILNSLFGSQVDVLKVIQKKERSEYVFKLTETPFKIQSKKRSVYNKLNYLPKIKGFTLKDAFIKNLFQLINNKIYFRGKLISPIENTLFHIIGNEGIMLEEISPISYNYFKEIIEKNSPNTKKLSLLKTLLQVMGWGRINIVIENEDKILFEIRNPPYGLQLEKDNWIFIIKIILGYLWLLNKKFKVTCIKREDRFLRITFSK